MSLEHRSLEEPEVHEVVRLRTQQEFGEVASPRVEATTRRLARPLAAGAGIAALLLAGLALVPRPVAEEVSSVVSGAVGRTVPVGSVGYGPDVAPGFVVDPSFRPGGELPRGFAISAMLGKTVYGFGDHHVEGAQPPDGPAAAQVEARIVELLEFLRDRPPPVEPIPQALYQDPAVMTRMPSITATLSLEWRNGSAGSMVTIPTASDPKANVELRRIAHNAARRMTDSLADSIQWMRKNDPSLP